MNVNLHNTLIIICGIIVAFLTWDSHQRTAELIETKDSTIKQLVSHIEQQNEMLAKFSDVSNKIDSSNADIKAELESMKGRTKALLGKPEITEALINKSFTTFEEKFSCLTGNNLLCAPL